MFSRVFEITQPKLSTLIKDHYSLRFFVHLANSFQLSFNTQLMSQVYSVFLDSLIVLFISVNMFYTTSKEFSAGNMTGVQKIFDKISNYCLDIFTCWVYVLCLSMTSSLLINGLWNKLVHECRFNKFSRVLGISLQKILLKISLFMVN